MVGGGQLGRCLSFLDKGAKEEEREGEGYIPAKPHSYLTCESGKFVMSKCK